ncbi:MAG: hypothetical protein HQK60_12180 [Deltaproteobacteria bacterium]|nr:hypothetical protein [Deltaproteobacteria bacterium]
MAEDDLIAALTMAVKEEVVENYLYNRRLTLAQIEDIDERARLIKKVEQNLVNGFARIYGLLLKKKYLAVLLNILGIDEAPFYDRCSKSPGFPRIGLIRVRSLTARGKYKKLLFKSYEWLCLAGTQFDAAYHDLKKDCVAVNYNIRKFRADFDILNIMSFLKGMDIVELEKKHFLGENFDAREIGSLERSMYIKDIKWEAIDLTPPPDLPPPDQVKESMEDLADRIFDENPGEVKKMLK